ncbi:hypothetical protein [Pelagibacterium montanilacus]|uniref:hypothetical protein n=1 Tax=Pelagibacterium montanilacus TaxID=2185280 RepID=UPI000F8CB605|nr:hypothetical protein [Pelagibacterium montanilacus]
MTDTPLGLFAYPWDVLDEGADAVLDAVERARLNTLYITAWYHSGMFLLPHNPRRRIHFPEPGALYFKPGPWHASGAQRPVISTLSNDWDRFWNELSEKASRRGISLAAWMPVLHNSGLGTAHSELAIRNAWGDVITHSLCPHAEPVKAIVANVVADVAALGIFERVLLESIEYLPLRHGHHHEVIGIPLDTDVDFLASLSFSEGLCQALAADGGDPEAVRAFVRSVCDPAMAGEPRTPMDWAGLEAAGGESFIHYLRVRERGLTELLKAAVAPARERGIATAILDFGPLYGLGANGRRWQNGVDLDAQLPLVDEIHPTFYFSDPDVLAAKIDAYRKVVGPEPKQVPAIRAIVPQIEDSEGLAAQVSAVRPFASGATFYNYSFMQLGTLDWIANAVSGWEN